MSQKTKIEIGDRIKFRVCLRSGWQTATRVVNGFHGYGGFKGCPTVRFNGFDNFIVRGKEIQNIIKSDKNEHQGA